MNAEGPSKMKPEFAEWMRNQLGYQASDMNVPVGGDDGTPRRVVAVRGETYGRLWHRLRSVALGAFAVAVLIRNVAPPAEGEVPVLPNALFAFAAVAYLVAHIGRVRTREYSWVECRDLNRSVSREDILKLDDAAKMTRASDAAGWKPARVLIVAGASGFADDAGALAQSLGVECYRRARGGFERVP